MAVLGGVGTVGAAVLVHVGVRLHVGVQHGFIDTGVVTLVTLEWLGVEMVAQVVFQMMLVLGDKGTVRTLEQLVLFDVCAGVLPELILNWKKI